MELLTKLKRFISKLGGTKECDGCHESFRKLENWGIWNFCEQCAERKGRLRATSEVPDIRIEDVDIETATRANDPDGAYTHVTETIKLIRFSSERRLYEVINHEYLHHLLNKFISVRTSYQYDNVSLYGEFDDVWR